MNYADGRALTLVLARSRNDGLLAFVHPTTPNPGIEIDIGFIDIKYRCFRTVVPQGLVDGPHFTGFGRVLDAQRRTCTVPMDS